MPKRFSSIAEARDLLEYYFYLYTATELDRSKPHPNLIHILQAAVRQYSGLLKNWSKAFDNFLFYRAATVPLTQKESAGAAILQIYRIMSEVLFKGDRSYPEGNECRWDRFLPQYTQVMKLAEDVVDFLKTENPSTTSLSLDNGIVSSLYGVAIQCRDPTIRRKAIALLRAGHRQEGVWNSVLIASVAEEVMNIEEEGLDNPKSCEDIPEWARIIAVDPTLDPDGRRAIVRYSKSGKPGSPRKTIEKVVEW